MRKVPVGCVMTPWRGLPSQYCGGGTRNGASSAGRIRRCADPQVVGRCDRNDLDGDNYAGTRNFFTGNSRFRITRRYSLGRNLGDHRNKTHVLDRATDIVQAKRTLWGSYGRFDPKIGCQIVSVTRQPTTRGVVPLVAVPPQQGPPWPIGRGYW